MHRRLADKKKANSDFHGTNGFMLHIPQTKEYLGIGHFHRPPGREANDYARFGHHYTHAFFTIPDMPPYHLQRLSQELLLLPATAPPSANQDNPEVIQFWSGIEWAATDTSTSDKKRDRLVLSYGINDCEGATRFLDWSYIDYLLQPVPLHHDRPNHEVIDLLQAAK